MPVFQIQECPMYATIIIGGDPTLGYTLSRHNPNINDEQWYWLKKLMNNAKDFDTTEEKPPFKCSCCGMQLKGSGEPLRHYLPLNLHHPSAISFCTSYSPRYSFLLCGDSKERGCVHRIMDILKISLTPERGKDERLLEIIKEVKKP